MAGPAWYTDTPLEPFLGRDEPCVCGWMSVPPTIEKPYLYMHVGATVAVTNTPRLSQADGKRPAACAASSPQVPGRGAL